MGPRSNPSPALDVSNRPEEETSPIQSNSGVSATDSLYAQSHTESLPDVRATGVFDPLPATDIGYFGELIAVVASVSSSPTLLRTELQSCTF